MKRPFDIVTFDCYGTLVDWESGIAGAFAGLAERSNQAAAMVEREKVLAAYAEREPLVQAERYRTYREVLAETARRVASALGFEVPAGEEDFLAASLAGWRPFSDTGPALRRLAAAGYGLGILSNVDEDLLRATRRHLPVEFDLIVTAQQVGTYKPAPGHFHEARRQVAGRPWLHAAQSFFHDVVPARALGIPVAWVNRKGESAAGGVRADRELRDLTELADWLAPR